MSIDELPPAPTFTLEQWRKFAVLILWKCAGTHAVEISPDTATEMMDNFSPGCPVMHVGVSGDTLLFSLKTELDVIRQLNLPK